MDRNFKVFQVRRFGTSVMCILFVCCLPHLPGNQASDQACCGVSKQLIFPWAGPADDEDDGGGDNEDDDGDDDNDDDDP